MPKEFVIKEPPPPPSSRMTEIVIMKQIKVQLRLHVPVTLVALKLRDVYWLLRVCVCVCGCVVLVPSYKKVKVKCTVVQALRLCTGRTAHRGSRGIAVLYRH